MRIQSGRVAVTHGVPRSVLNKRLNGSITRLAPAAGTLPTKLGDVESALSIGAHSRRKNWLDGHGRVPRGVYGIRMRGARVYVILMNPEPELQVFPSDG